MRERDCRAKAAQLETSGRRTTPPFIMIKPDRQFLDSVRAINKTYAERDTALVLSAALTDSLTRIATLYGQARVAERGMVAPKGVAADKDVKIKAACQAVFYICEGIGSYAHKIGNTVLAASADHSVTDLIRIKDADITTQLESLVATARGLLTELAYAEITSNELDAADDLIDAMDAALGNPRDSVDKRKLAGEDFGRILGEIRLELEQQTDKLINRLLIPDTTPAGDLRRAFAAKYEASRNIKGTASQQTPTPANTTTTTPPTTPVS